MKQVVKNIFIILTVPEKQKGWLLALADVMTSIVDIVFLLVLLFLVNFYTQPVHATMAGNISLAILNEHPVLLVFIFFFLFTLKNIAGFTVSKMQYQYVYDVASRISKQNLSQYLQGSYHSYVNIDSSVAHRKISQEPIEFGHYVLNGAQQIFSQAILVIITSVAIVIFHPLLFPLLVLILAPPVLLIAFLMKRKLSAARVNGKKTSEQAMQHLQEALAGYVESNVYGKYDFFIGRYHRLQIKLNHYLSTNLIIQNMPPRLIEVFAVFGLLVLVIVHYIATRSHSIQLVTIGALMIAAYKIIPGIVKITNTIGQVKSYSFAATDLAAMLHLPEKNNYQTESIKTIDFVDVCFNYPGKKGLTSFSLSIQRGDFTVITGDSGKGKTTLINLLLGFLSPAAGNILINGRITDPEERQQCWNKISYAKQQGFFLHATIIQNICLQDEHYDEAKIKKILTVTGLDKLLHSFAQGLETIITENGKNISGGQRQRIIFARALYNDFDLLVLDEPFNELDEASETAMLCVLQNIAAEGKIIILVTHNKTAISFSNKKVLLDER